MELESLLGKHTLTGVDEYNETIKSFGVEEDANFIAFALDGKTYIAAEDPEDGYRSHMKDLVCIETDQIIKNKFDAVEVIGKMKGPGEYAANDILELIDTKTGKIILEIGTENTDDYYPYFVGKFYPENMIINQGSASF